MPGWTEPAPKLTCCLIADEFAALHFSYTTEQCPDLLLAHILRQIIHYQIGFIVYIVQTVIIIVVIVIARTVVVALIGYHLQLLSHEVLFGCTGSRGRQQTGVAQLRHTHDGGSGCVLMGTHCSNSRQMVEIQVSGRDACRTSQPHCSWLLVSTGQRLLR